MSPEGIQAALMHPELVRYPQPFGPLGSYSGFATLRDLLGGGLPVLVGDAALARRREVVLPAMAGAQRS